MPFARLPEPWTFFIDRCFGTGVVPDAFRAALGEDGGQVVLHDDEFPQTALDREWLPVIGARGLILITKDYAIRRNPLELIAIVSAGVAAFALGNANQSGERSAGALVAALRAMQRTLRGHAPPFIATVTMAGEVYLGWDENGRLDKPKHIKGGPARAPRHSSSK